MQCAKSDFVFVNLSLWFRVFLQQNIAVSSRPKLKFHSHALDIWHQSVTIHSLYRCIGVLAWCETFPVCSYSKCSLLTSTFHVHSSQIFFQILNSSICTDWCVTVYMTYLCSDKMSWFLELFSIVFLSRPVELYVSVRVTFAMM